MSSLYGIAPHGASEPGMRAPGSWWSSLVPPEDLLPLSASSHPGALGDEPASPTARKGPGGPVQTVLLVEDSPGDAALVRGMLEEAGAERYEVETVTRLSAAKDRLLWGGVVVVLLDLGLPDSDGIATVAELCAFAQEVPVVVLTGREDQALGVEALRQGAEDYLVKGRVHGPALRRVIRYACERKQAGEVAARLAALVESSDDAIMGWSLSGTVVDWNPAAERLLGYSAAAARGQSIDLLAAPGRHYEIHALFDLARRGERVDRMEMTCRRKDGNEVDVILSISAIRNRLGRVVGISTSARDITERRKAEESLRQTQKMESIGILAGGIAHDFNNLLGMILGDNSLALAKLPPESPARPNLERALTAVQRAADLTRQLLAYSGRGRFNVQLVNLNDLIRENAHMFEVALPKNVRLECDLKDGVPPIEADVGQIQQVIMNLIINGAEAIGGEPGTVHVATGLRDVGDDSRHVWASTGTPLPAGRYVGLTIEDDGRGMDRETLSRIFEPFFTTKTTGRGLGLAAALGIVRGHKGGLAVRSEPGRGTSFELVFPVSQGVVRPRASSPSGGGALVGTVLVIDDEEQLRDVAADILSSEGLRVICAADGASGLARYQERMAEIDLVILDLTMRGLGGEETFGLLRAINPSVPILVTSGYDEAEVGGRFPGGHITAFVQKPYTVSSLMEAVRRSLEGEHAEGKEADKAGL